MDAFSRRVKWLPVLAACVMAKASYPPIPADLTTPVQQRIAINGPGGEFVLGVYDLVHISKARVLPFTDLLLLRFQPFP